MNSPRDIGMQRALEFEERAHPKWSDVALQYIEHFARRNPTFTSEQCTAASVAFGLVTTQPKAWGSIYVRAAKLGIITKTGRYEPSYRRHQSPTPVWRSNVYRDAA